jgi:hypothetical protein
MMLFYSSWVFLGNAATTFYKKYYLYSFLFLGLTITSLVFHWAPTPEKMLVDQCFVAAVILCGGYVFYEKWPANGYLAAVVVTTFLLTGFLHPYGFCTQQYCFHPEYGDHYHALLHLIASFSHHLITFM